MKIVVRTTSDEQTYSNHEYEIDGAGVLRINEAAPFGTDTFYSPTMWQRLEVSW